MKKNFIYLSIALIVSVTAACKKDSSTTTPPTTASTFVVNGNTYTETNSGFSIEPFGTAGNFATLAVLGTKGTAKSELIFYFGSSTKPVAGVYPITDDLSTNAAGKVGILASDSVNVAKEGLYTAQPGTSVTVTVSSSGKLTVKMPATTFTGSNFDNSDPKNTNVTDVTISASGTVNEN